MYFMLYTLYHIKKRVRMWASATQWPQCLTRPSIPPTPGGLSHTGDVREEGGQTPFPRSGSEVSPGPR